MGEGKAPSAADLAVLDPDGSFVSRLRADQAAFTKLALGLWALPEDARRVSLAKIEVLAHRLAGAAGTFGYANVGEAALELETCAAAPEDRSSIVTALAGLGLALELSGEPDSGGVKV